MIKLHRPEYARGFGECAGRYSVTCLRQRGRIPYGQNTNSPARSLIGSSLKMVVFFWLPKTRRHTLDGWPKLRATDSPLTSKSFYKCHGQSMPHLWILSTGASSLSAKAWLILAMH